MSLVTIPEPYRRAMTRAGTIVSLGSGEYADGDQNNYIGKSVKVRGAGHLGPNRTLLVNGGYKQSANGCTWQAANGVLFEDIALECRTDWGQQNCVFGFQSDYGLQHPVEEGSVATINRGAILGRTYGFYSWAEGHPTLRAFKSFISAGTIAVMGGQSSGPDAQLIELYDTDVVVDYDKYPSAGVGTDTVAGLCVRGGVMRMYGGSITVRGSSRMVGAVGAWASWFSADAPWPWDWPVLELVGVTFDVQANGSAGAWDILQDVGVVYCDRCKRADGKPLRIKGDRVYVNGVLHV